MAVEFNISFGGDTQWMTMGPAFIGMFDREEPARTVAPKAAPVQPAQVASQPAASSRAPSELVLDVSAPEVSLRRPKQVGYRTLQISSTQVSARPFGKRDMSSSWETIATGRRAMESTASLSLPASPVVEAPKPHVIYAQHQPEQRPMSGFRTFLQWLFG